MRKAMSEAISTGANGKKMKHLWMVEDRPARGDKPPASFWTKVGVAFENRDGSWSLEMAAMPVNGRLQMRDPLPPREDAPSGGAPGGGPRAAA
jgi:hypothetical protein